MLRRAPALLTRLLVAVCCLVAPGAALAACPETAPTPVSRCGPTFTLPGWSDGGGWDAPGTYDTIQLGDIDGLPGDELIGRSRLGLWVHRWDRDAGQWVQYGAAGGGMQLDLSDVAGFGQPDTYRTIQVADVTGDRARELLVRGRDGVGVYAWDAAGRRFTRLPGAGPYGNQDYDSGLQPSVYETIQTGHGSAGQPAQLFSYGVKGDIRTFRWQAGAGWSEYASYESWYFPPGTPFPSTTTPPYFEPLQAADIDANGSAELLMRLPGPRAGLYAFRFAYQDLPVAPILLDDAVWQDPGYYSTIQTGDVDGDGGAEVLARGPGGLLTWHYTGQDTNTWTQAPALADLGAAAAQPGSYRTIQTADLDGDGRAELMARLADGMHVWRFTNGAWAPTATGASLALADDPWAAERYADTVQAGDVDGDGKAELVARGPYGIRTFRWARQGDAWAFVPAAAQGFPPFGAADATAYAALSRYLLDGSSADVRTTYATARTGQIAVYMQRIQSLCAAGQPAGAWTSCAAPPAPYGQGVDPAAVTRVANAVWDELAAVDDVVDHFTQLDDILTKRFLDQDGTLPAIDADLRLPPDPPPVQADPLRLVQTGLTLLVDVADLIPEGNAVGKFFTDFPQIVRSLGLTADILGAVADATPPPPAPPSPAATWAQTLTRVKARQDAERQALDDQRAQVLGDRGLLLALGGMVNDGLLPLQEDAAVSAGRQAFTLWALQAYLPAYWARYRFPNCVGSDPEPRCLVQGPMVRRTGTVNGTVVDAVMGNGTDCYDDLFKGVGCNLFPPGDAVTGLLSGPVTPDCRFAPPAGGRPLTEYRYGCSLGVAGGDVLDNLNGWQLPGVRVCDFAQNPVCQTRAGAAATAGSAVVHADGTADVRLQATLPPLAAWRTRGRDLVRIGGVLTERRGGAADERVGWPQGDDLAGVTLTPAGGGPAAAAHGARRPGARLVVRVSDRARRGHRLALHARGVRLEVPEACGRGRARVRLETRVRIGDRRADRRLHRTAAIPSTWRCVRDASGRLTGLRLVRP